MVTSLAWLFTDLHRVEAHHCIQKQVALSRPGKKLRGGSMTKLTQDQLATRWHMSPRTLEQWRWLGKGPRFLKIGARVLYDEAEIEAFEAGQVCQNTHGPIGAESL